MLGRFPGLQRDAAGWYSPQDLVRYSAPGTEALALDQPAYFSINGGMTKLNGMEDTINPGDPSDWTADVHSDAFGVGYENQTMVMTSIDKTMMDVLGYNIAGAAAANFEVLDRTTGNDTFQLGDNYSGLVDLRMQFLNPISDDQNVVIQAAAPGSWVMTGDGEDAITDQGNGNNVLDGQGGSNFLVGGGGNDTFYIDDRTPASVIWSTIANFHSGDTQRSGALRQPMLP